jgi:DNA-binding PadR family transcriptional regulator
MARVFRRGELKEAIMVVLANIGEGHGYAIMGELEARVEGGWKASPGAIYPALMALVESGHIRFEDRDDLRVYELTDTGRRAAAASSWGNRWSALTAKAERADDRVALGSLLDEFASASPLRRRLAGSDQQQEIESILERAHAEIEETLEEGKTNG